ncbi:DUF58 domain-containing protein [candidate division KSB1 bacterium]|mgnify:CR=1 FL=1|nr:MAG: DUF58 domain-containing protein [candidate division KSB1 bacterium]
MKDYRKFLKPETISKLANLELKARLVVEGFIIGLHKSPYHGFSVEFAEHRQYMPGDEIKHIDWKVYGKTDKFYVKEYEEETNLKAYILLDASGSMGYTSGKIKKIEYASYLAASLTYLILKQRDAIGLAIFDKIIRKYIPPRSILSYFYDITRELNNLKTGEVTNIHLILHTLAERIKRRGLIILISDLFDDPEKILSGLKHFRHKKHEVIIFHILDPFEIEFSFKRDSVFRDMETKDEMNIQPWHLRKEYKQQIRMFIDSFKKNCLENRIDYVLMKTDTDLDQALFEYLVKRKKLG